MSCCDSPDCEACRPLNIVPRVPTPAATPREELEQMLGELKGLRIEARQLTKSGHPGVRAEAFSSVAKLDSEIRWINHKLSKEK